MCLDYDELTKQPIGKTNRYPTDAERLIVYFKANTNIEVDITYRWWYEDSLLGDFTVGLDDGYNFGWITPQGPLLVGDYKAEIVSGNITLRDVMFEVVP